MLIHKFVTYSTCLAVALCALLVLPTVTAAETVVRYGETFSITDDQIVENDLYVAAGIISVSGVIEEDMYAVGGSVTINGSVGADLSLLSGAAQVHATVTDDVRVIGGDVVIAGDVGGDVFVMGGVVQVLSTAQVRGDVYFFGGQAVIEGQVDGSVLGMMETLRVNGQVGKDVQVRSAGPVELGSQSFVEGSVQYQSPVELVRAPESVVNGEIVRNTIPASSAREIAQDILTVLLVLLFTVLTLYLFFRDKVLLPIQVILTERLLFSVALGLSALILIPVIISILFVSVLGSVIGIALLFSFILLLLFSFFASPFFVGYFVARRLNAKNPASVWWVVIGFIIFLFIAAVPLIGQACVLALLSAVLGAVLMSLYRYLT